MSDMTVADLIEHLKTLSQDHVVEIWDPEIKDWMPITGMTYSSKSPVRLYSDDQGG